jgi:RNA polymerase sigma-70 factor (ECF subfamily)
VTPEEFKDLFDAHFDPLRNYVYYRSGDKELATDIAQECFLRLWEKQNHHVLQQQVGLLYKMAGNLFISKYRHSRVEKDFALTRSDNGHSLSPEEVLSYKELDACYQAALKTMPEKLRVVFLMSRQDELKNREIAERLRLSVKAVEKRMTAALKYLKAALSI